MGEIGVREYECSRVLSRVSGSGWLQARGLVRHAKQGVGAVRRAARGHDTPDGARRDGCCGRDV